MPTDESTACFRRSDSGGRERERERERAQERDRARGKGILGLIFAGYVLLASQNAADSTFY